MAHDAVLSSVPADSQVVNEFPREIELIFSGDPQANFNTVAVSDADARKVLYSHEPTVVGNQVKLSIPEDINPGPGNYIVGFQITSSDGHSTRGKTSFSVAGEGAADAAGKKIQTQSSDAGAEDTVGIPTWAFGLGGGLIVLIAVVVIAINRKAK
nr:copper resistance CopC family protein [Corynebacterium lactis]